MFGLDAYLVQPEENKKSLSQDRKLYLKLLYMYYDYMSERKKLFFILSCRRYGGLLITSIIGSGLIVATLSNSVNDHYSVSENFHIFFILIVILLIEIFKNILVNIKEREELMVTITDHVADNSSKLHYMKRIIVDRRVRDLSELTLSSRTYGKIISGIIGGGLIGAILYGLVGAFFGSVIGVIITLSTFLDKILPPKMDISIDFKFLLLKYLKMLGFE